VCCSVLQCVADIEVGPSFVGFSDVGCVLGDQHIGACQSIILDHVGSMMLSIKS